MKLKNTFIKVLLGQLFIDILVVVVFYFLIPSLMNYADYTIELNLTEKYMGISYFAQALLMFLPYTFIMLVFLICYLKDMIKYGNKNIIDIPSEIRQRLSIRLINTPIICYLVKLICIPVTVSFTLISVSVPAFITIKLTIIVTIFFLLDGSIIYTFTKSLFKNLIKASNNFNNLYGLRMSLKKEIFIQFITMVCASLIFIFILSYSRIIEEKGNALYSVLNDKISDFFDTNKIDIENFENILSELKNFFNNDEKYTYFFINSNNEIKVLDNKQLTEYEKFYIPIMIELNKDRISDISKENQGIIKVFQTENGNYTYGILFSITPFDSIPYFIYTMLILLLLNIIIIVFYCKNMSKNISEVSIAVERVASGHEVDFERKIAVTSNDEIGELVIAFNNILLLEKENVETKERNQDIMVEQERLSSLGQLIGGIAHNLKTPIMSIAGVVEGLTDLIKEYDESIDDPLVNKQDHHEIAKDMQNWVDKIKPYLSYMTEVIDAVKGQAVSMNASTMTNFTIKELITRTQLLMKNELKRRHCNLNLDITANEFTAISGEISALIQVIDNMIINAMDAYGDKAGDVDIKVREDDTKVYIDVTDYAGGIPQKVQDKLFKEMITSKGKNGTGLGLYMSFSTIKGKFKGDIRYETEEGKGTTFFIELPKYVG